MLGLHTLKGAEEYYERAQFPKCGRLLYSGERDSETVAAQFLSRACSVSTVWRTTVQTAQKPSVAASVLRLQKVKVTFALLLDLGRNGDLDDLESSEYD